MDWFLKSVFLVMFIYGCSDSHETALKNQSIEAHNKALKIGQSAKTKIDKMKELIDTIDLELEKAWVDSVSKLDEDWKIWNSTVVEVPGHEHEHAHDEHHDHSHDHNAQIDLTPEMVLEVQQDLEIRAVKLNDRVDRLMEIIKTNENESVQEK